jgi:predicted HTH transcriptional regulator
MVRKPSTENERILSTVLLIFIIFFGIDAIFSLFFEESSRIMHYRMTLSFVIGMGIGFLFYLWARPSEFGMDRSIDILQRALTEDEILLLDIIRNSEGVTQDSLRFRTGFSKSKVSALLLNLEKKGIISRERLGRTYKVYISDWLKK